MLDFRNGRKSEASRLVASFSTVCVASLTEMNLLSVDAVVKNKICVTTVFLGGVSVSQDANTQTHGK